MCHIALLGCCFTSLACAAEPMPTQKRGGVCFRGDDNQTPEKWLRLVEIFERHGFRVCASLNLLKVAHRPDYMAFVKDLQARGHEVMDHSPTHRGFSMTFQTAQEAAAYAGKPGVDHVAGPTVYFRYVPPESLERALNGLADVQGSRFASTDARALAKWKHEPFTMLDGDPHVYILDGDGDLPTRLKSLWGEDTVDLPARKGVRFCRVWKGHISVVPDALRCQAKVVQDICTRYGIKPPTTWIQPGGREPVLRRGALKQVLGDEFGYTAAGSYPDAALKCFNEHDPLGDKRFGMSWGNFQEDRFGVEQCQERIADGIAKHCVMFGHSHLNGSREIGGWEGYLRNTEELLKWCRAKGIPVRTYSEWADILYSRPTDPSVNAFPDITTDLDGDGKPDGISLGPKVTVVDDAPAGVGASLSVPPNGRACRVRDLTGIEKGPNAFALQMHGPLGSKVQVRFTSRDAKVETEWLTFEQAAAGWQRHEGQVVVPQQVSRLTIDIMRRDRSEPRLLITGISLSGTGRGR